MKKQRKQYKPEEKVAILRRHLLEKEPISSCAMKRDSSHEVLAELMAEHVALEKDIGEL